MHIHTFKLEKATIFILFCSILLAMLLVLLGSKFYAIKTSATEDDFIKWVDFTPTYSVLEKTASLDITSHNEGSSLQYDWIELLAYLGASYGGDFSRYKEKDLTELTARLENGETMDQITQKMNYYDYYKKCYDAVLSNFIGEYEIQTSEGQYEKKYGIKAYLPVAKNYGFSHYDDFGNARSYGYARKHLGNDLMGSIGTPIIAVEGGVVEAMGWNQYGGWRVGIRSMDGKRYYYYAHLRKDHPFHDELYEGKIVSPGDVIGYLGMTGYSTTENVNNITTPHLHFGMQLIFDESQKDENEIWIDVYQIIEFLKKNQCEVVSRATETSKEYDRKYAISDEFTDVFAADGVSLPILMYHSVLKDPDRTNKYTITPARLRQDFDLIRSRGYTTITMTELIDYVHNSGPLPEKPIIVTFDDGFYNNYGYVVPILEEYGMKAVISVVGEYTDKYTEENVENLNYGYLRWQDVKTLIDSNVFEVQNHSYSFHSTNGSRKGSKKKDSESDAAYKKVFVEDTKKMQAAFLEHTGYTPNTYTYPFGAISLQSNDYVKEMGFSASLSCNEGINTITKDPECLYLLKRYNRPGDMASEAFFQKIGI